MSRTLRAPFRLDGGRIQTTVSTTQQVEQKIINVMTTRTLERVGLPEYGGNVASLMFEQLDTLEWDDYKVDLISEITRNVSGVSILDVRVRPEDIFTHIVVRYMMPLSNPTEFEFQITSPGALNEETPL